MNHFRRQALAILLSFLSVRVVAAQPDFRAWIDSPEAYFATEEERAEWNKVSSKEDADRFIAEYWKKRGRQFERDVKTRVERADEMFSLGLNPGSRTPRGRVWIILGSPNRQQTIRSNTIESGLPGQFQNNTVERGAIQSIRWVYQKDRLPEELGVPELTVMFQTNTSRGHQVIENPGLVEPYLKRAGAFFSTRQMLAASTASIPGTTTTAPTTGDDPLWQAVENLRGTSFTGEAYVSAREKPFYAVSFYIPKNAEPFAPWKSVLFVGLIRTPDGATMAATREQLPLRGYGMNGDRYVDRSFPLEPGKYSGAFAIFTPEGSTMLANRLVEFEVPKPTEPRISSLLPTGAIETFDKQSLYDPFTFVATKYAIKGDRKYTTNEKVGFFAVIENPAGEPQPLLTMSMSLYKDGKLLDKTPPDPAPLTQTGPHSWLVGPLFEAGTFKPGRYTIELKLRDMKAARESPAFTQGFSAKTEFEVVQ